MRHALIASLLVCLGAVGAAQVTDKDLLNPDPNDFLLYSGTYDSQRHSLLKQITLPDGSILGNGGPAGKPNIQ